MLVCYVSSIIYLSLIYFQCFSITIYSWYTCVQNIKIEQERHNLYGSINLVYYFCVYTARFYACANHAYVHANCVDHTPSPHHTSRFMNSNHNHVHFNEIIMNYYMKKQQQTMSFFGDLPIEVLAVRTYSLQIFILLRFQ